MVVKAAGVQSFVLLLLIETRYRAVREGEVGGISLCSSHSLTNDHARLIIMRFALFFTEIESFVYYL